MANSAFHFPDPGLHIGVLGMLLEDEIISEEPIRTALADIASEDEFERLARGVEALQQIPISEDQLAKVTTLHFDGGNAIYMVLEECVECYTGGETDDYSLGSLEGIGKLLNLTYLDLSGHGFHATGIDLAPLADHPTLKRIDLSGPVFNVATLESVSTLTKVIVAPSDEPSVFDRLKARGVSTEED
jgi:hypothetical protein